MRKIRVSSELVQLRPKLSSTSNRSSVCFSKFRGSFAFNDESRTSGERRASKEKNARTKRFLDSGTRYRKLAERKRRISGGNGTAYAKFETAAARIKATNETLDVRQGSRPQLPNSIRKLLCTGPRFRDTDRSPLLRQLPVLHSLSLCVHRSPRGTRFSELRYERLSVRKTRILIS